jgi:hypothetical protein
VVQHLNCSFRLGICKVGVRHWLTEKPQWFLAKSSCSLQSHYLICELGVVLMYKYLSVWAKCTCLLCQNPCAFLNTYIHTYTRPYICTYTYIHMYILVYIHTHKHTYIQYIYIYIHSMDPCLCHRASRKSKIHKIYKSTA